MFGSIRFPEEMFKRETGCVSACEELCNKRAINHFLSLSREVNERNISFAIGGRKKPPLPPALVFLSETPYARKGSTFLFSNLFYQAFLGLLLCE